MCKGISQEIIIGGNRYDHVIKGWQLPKMQKYIPDLPLP